VRGRHQAPRISGTSRIMGTIAVNAHTLRSDYEHARRQQTCCAASVSLRLLDLAPVGRLKDLRIACDH